MRRLWIVAAAFLLSACEPPPPLVLNVGNDKVVVRTWESTGWSANSTADRTCALYKKKAQGVSYVCADSYCIAKDLLYACVEKE